MPLSKELYIVGAGGVGRHIAANMTLYNLKNKKVYFIDDNLSLHNTIIDSVYVIGGSDYLTEINYPIDVVVSIALPSIKSRIIKKVKENPNLFFPNCIAKNAWISKDITIGEGIIIYPHCSINIGTKINNFVLINMNCAVGHDCIIGKYVFLAPSVSLGGWTILGDGCQMGISSTTLQNIKLVAGCQVGAKTLVNRSFLSTKVIVGVPGKELKNE